MSTAELETVEVPTEDLQRYFWKWYGAEVEPGQEVFVAQDMLPADRFRDAQGQAVPGLAPRRPAALFFIDRMPPANWAHPCTYVAIEPGGEASKVDHIWPPAEEIRLLRLRRT